MKATRHLLLIDPLSPKGHRSYNLKFAKLCERVVEKVTVIVDKNFFDEFNTNTLDVEEVLFTKGKEIQGKCCISFLKKIYNRCVLIKNLFSTLKVAKHYEFDSIIFMSFEEVSMWIASWFIKKPFAVILHQGDSIYRSRFKRKLLEGISKRASIIVFEEYIKEYILNHCTSDAVVHVVYHPLDSLPVSTVNKYSNRIVIFAPGHYNSEKFAIDLKKFSNTIPNNYEIRFRSSLVRNCVCNNVLFLPEWISENDYREFCNEADYFLVAYDKTYNYRLSGILFDAVASGKGIILLSGNTLSTYHERFPESIVLINSVEDLSQICGGGISFNHDAFINEYSDESICKQLKSVLISLVL